VTLDGPALGKKASVPFSTTWPCPPGTARSLIQPAPGGGGAEEKHKGRPRRLMVTGEEVATRPQLSVATAVRAKVSKRAAWQRENSVAWYGVAVLVPKWTVAWPDSW
jgi:hypothetical protein